MSFSLLSGAKEKFHITSSQIIPDMLDSAGLTHQCLYFEQPHTFEQILFIQTAEPALVGHA